MAKTSEDKWHALPTHHIRTRLILIHIHQVRVVVYKTRDIPSSDFGGFAGNKCRVGAV